MDTHMHPAKLMGCMPRSASIPFEDAQQSLLLSLEDRDQGQDIFVRSVAFGSRAQQVRALL